MSVMCELTLLSLINPRYEVVDLLYCLMEVEFSVFDVLITSHLGLSTQLEVVDSATSCEVKVTL